MATYSEAFKEAMVSKLLHPDGRSIVELSEETGVSKASLYKWKTDFQEQSLEQGTEDMAKTEQQPIRPQNWSAEAKLKAVNETFSMTEEQIGAYCREHGIYSNHLDRWRTDLIAGLHSSAQKAQKTEIFQLKTKVKSLTKDLARKEKALAETSALLILKKKANLLWGEAKDDQ